MSIASAPPNKTILGIGPSPKILGSPSATSIQHGELAVRCAPGHSGFPAHSVGRQSLAASSSFATFDAIRHASSFPDGSPLGGTSENMTHVPNVWMLANSSGSFATFAAMRQRQA
jgi:hypothetical protein